MVMSRDDTGSYEIGISSQTPDTATQAAQAGPQCISLSLSNSFRAQEVTKYLRARYAAPG